MDAIDLYDTPIDLRPIPKVNLDGRVSRAVDVLKAAITNERFTMIAAEVRHNRVSNKESDAEIKQNLVEYALDVLCGEFD